MRLKPDLAASRMGEMAEQLHMDAIQLAHSIIEIANENMANAIRMVSIERGHDPRRFALIAFGGAGPLHGASIARKLEIPRVVIPPFPGAFSAMGLLMADLRVDKVWTQAFRSDQVSVETVAGQFRRITESACTELRNQGYTGEPETHYYINMRYLGQNYENEVEIPPLAPHLPFGRMEAGAGLVAGEGTLREAYEAFHRMHEAMYGYRIPTAVIELISFKVTVVGATPKPKLGTLPPVE
jgi:N-methylhydantoinase A